MVNNELTHHGIKGMKWGVRRSEAQLRRARGKLNSEDYETAKTLRKKKTRQLSNAELRKVNERKQLENQYTQLNPSTFKKGVAFVAATTAVMATLINFYNTGKSAGKIAQPAVDKMLDKVVDGRVGDMLMKDLAKTING